MSSMKQAHTHPLVFPAVVAPSLPVVHGRHRSSPLPLHFSELFSPSCRLCVQPSPLASLPLLLVSRLGSDDFHDCVFGPLAFNYFAVASHKCTCFIDIPRTPWYILTTITTISPYENVTVLGHRFPAVRC